MHRNDKMYKAWLAIWWGIRQLDNIFSSLLFPVFSRFSTMLCVNFIHMKKLLKICRKIYTRIVSNKREAGRDLAHAQKRRQCDRRDRDWRDASTNQGMHTWATRSWKRQVPTDFSPGTSGESMTLLTPWVQILGLQNWERIHFCCFKPFLLF